jgi:hypothetical protein
MKIKKCRLEICLLGALLWCATAQADFIYSTSNGQITITGYSGTVPANLVIPATINGLPVVSIGIEAFNSSLNIVVLPATITNIEYDAFTMNVFPLYRVYFNGNAPNLEQYAFNGVAVGFKLCYLFGTTGWSANYEYEGYDTTPYYAPFNGGFEDTGDFFGWTVSGNGSSQSVGPNVYSGQYAAVFTETASRAGQHGVLVPGSSNVLSQACATQAGTSYMLSFAVNGLTNGVCSASWNGNTLVNQNFNPGWTNLQFIVTATGASTVLQFTFPPLFGSPATTAIDSVTLIPMPKITSQTRSGSTMGLTIAGAPNANYAVDRTFNLKPPVNWVPQLTNTTAANGVGGFYTTINPATNNFWRVRYVP